MDLGHECKQDKSSQSTGQGRLIIYLINIHTGRAKPRMKFSQTEFDAGSENIRTIFFSVALVASAA